MTRYTNPFIKTPAQRELEDAVVVFKIWFYSLDYGDPVGDGFTAFYLMTKVLHKAISGPDKDTLAVALEIFEVATEYNSWRKSYTGPVNDAMDIVLKRFPKLPQQIAAKALAAVFSEVPAMRLKTIWLVVCATVLCMPWFLLWLASSAVLIVSGWVFNIKRSKRA